MFSKPLIISIICLNKEVSISTEIILKTTWLGREKEKSDSHEIFAEVTFPKINSLKVLGKAQFAKIATCQMFGKTTSPKVGHNNQVSIFYDD